jgi:hypothetical protein
VTTEAGCSLRRVIYDFSTVHLSMDVKKASKMHLSEAYSISEVILGSSQHCHLLNKHESILLTLIPPSVSIYGSQILLYKCLKYTNAIQMKPPSALWSRG